MDYWKIVPSWHTRRTFQNVCVFPLSPSSSLPPESSQNHVLELATLPSSRWSSSSSSTVQARGASIGCGRRGTRGTAPASQGSSRRRLSRGRSARWCRGPKSCLASLTECCDRVWWFTLSYPGSHATPHAASVLFSLKDLLFSYIHFRFTLTILIFFI